MSLRILKNFQILAVAVLMWMSASLHADEFIDRILVVVNNVPITLSEYRVRHRQEIINGTPLPPFSGKVDSDLLKSMIDERLQAVQAERQGVTVSEQEIDSTVELIAQRNGITSSRLLNQLAADGIGNQEFRANLREQQLIRKLIDVVAHSRVVVSDQEVEDYLNAHQELQSGKEYFEVSHLIIDIRNKTEEQVQVDRENMEMIRQRILDGLPFAQAVRDYSDAASKEEGGYLGWRSTDQLPELFLQELRTLDGNAESLTPVLDSGTGMHLLRLHGRRVEGEVVRQQLIQHILIAPDEENTIEEAGELVRQIYDQLAAGEPFDKMVRIHSMDPRSRDNDGSLGWVNPGDLVPEFERVAGSLDLDEISQPVRTPYGFHIIRVLERRNVNLEGEVAANRARQEIFQRKSAEMYFDWFQALRQRAYIEYVGLPEETGN